MNWILLWSLLGACGLLLILEQLGLATTLALRCKGDLKRETGWLAQYGQAASILAAAAIAYELDERHPISSASAIVIATFGAAIVGRILKQLFGRIRPGRENAGRFLGPTWRHQSYRESFPSSHTSSAIAMSAVLATLYPSAATTFWALGIACALLRYAMDAHWPSDVLAGVALGYSAAILTIHALRLP